MANNKQKSGKKNPDLALYYLLHTNPIYKYIKNQENIHIMILGAEKWAQRFIGIALQTCQVVDRSVTITVACVDPENAIREYLKIRPAVPEFINVKLFSKNGTFVDIKQCDENGNIIVGNEDIKKEFYGTLNFVNKSLVNNVKQKKDYFKEYGKPQYLFIDTGEKKKIETKRNWNRGGNKNRSSLRSVMEAFNFQNENYRSINYVVTGQETATEVLKGGKPVFVNKPIPKEKLERLDQMAFNAHLSWYNTLNIDQVKEREKFREDTYNYNSSLAFVLSIPYKLWSAHIIESNCDIDKESVIARAASDFQKLLDSHTTKCPNNDYLQLIQLEHRRWVLEKICDVEKVTKNGQAQGWQAPDKIDGGFVDGCIERCSVKDKKKKIHPCIVRSTEKMPLKNGFYSNEPQDLDELDRMSIDLHRLFSKAAQEVIKRKPLENEKSDICKLEKLLFGQANEVLRAFNRYRYCIKNILAGNKAYSKQFERVQEDLKKVLAEIQWNRDKTENRTEIFGGENRDGLLKSIADMIFPVIESNLHRDYKSLDEELVKNIPFILTYKQVQDLFLVFDDGLKEYGRRNNNAVFQNVASATVLNPRRITYLYYFDDANEKTVINRFTTVLEYLFKRIEGCQVNLAIAFRSRPNKKWEQREVDFFINMASEQLVQNDNKQINFKTKVCQNKKEAIAFFKNLLSIKTKAIYDASTEVFNSDNDAFNDMQKELLPWFRFSNFKDKHFTDVNRCDFLKYIEKGGIIEKTCLRVEDVFSLMNAQNKKYYVPEFIDAYEELWKIYTGELLNEQWESGVSNWTAFCNRLLNYVQDKADKNDKGSEQRVRRIDKDKRDIEIELVKGPEALKKVYVFPEKFSTNVEEFCENLFSLHILLEQPEIDKGKVTIKTVYDLDEDLFKKIFKSAAAYFTGGWLSARREARPEKEILIVSYNNLKVENLKLTNSYTDQQIKRILDKLNVLSEGVGKNKFIEDFKTEPDGTVSFKFTSEHVKKLLCTAGEILEIYTYFDVLKTGYFDDVVCSYEFQWKSGVENELDCVLTKGFKSIIVECKSRAKLEPGFYHKLANISNLIGIAEKSVLLANTYKQDERLEQDNQKLIDNGNLMGVITVNKREDIEHIGQKLCEIMGTKVGGNDYV